MLTWEKIRGKLNNKKFIIFGTGFFSELWYQRLKGMGYLPMYFSDNNSDVWNKEVIDGIFCISPSEIKVKAAGTVCLLCVNDTLRGEISQSLIDRGIAPIFMDERLTNEYDFIRDYFKTDICINRNACIDKEIQYDYSNLNPDKNREKIAVYTAIFGDYDELIQPEVTESICDYYCISDEKPKNLGIYKWIPFEKICKEKLDNNLLKNRYCKILPQIFFPQYKYSLYLDGNIRIKNSIERLVNDLDGANIGFFNHPSCNDLYVEAFRFCDLYFDKESIIRIKAQMLRYANEGFPFAFGFVENGVIVRKHNEQLCVLLMKTWWEEYRSWITRDQLSFMYSLWKCNMTKKDVAIFGTDWRKSSEFEFVFHKHENKREHICFIKNRGSYSY